MVWGSVTEGTAYFNFGPSQHSACPSIVHLCEFSFFASVSALSLLVIFW